MMRGLRALGDGFYALACGFAAIFGFVDDELRARPLTAEEAWAENRRKLEEDWRAVWGDFPPLIDDWEDRSEA